MTTTDVLATQPAAGVAPRFVFGRFYTLPHYDRHRRATFHRFEPLAVLYDDEAGRWMLEVWMLDAREKRLLSLDGFLAEGAARPALGSPGAADEP